MDAWCRLEEASERLSYAYLVGFKNRFTTVVAWLITFLGRGRGQMTITSQMIYARLAMNRLREKADALEAAEQAEEAAG